MLNFSNQVITLILTFVSRTFFIQAFGVEFLGLNGIFTDVLGMLSVADLGFNTAMVFSLYKPLAEGDKKKIAQYITFYRKVYYIIAASVTVAGVTLIPVLPYIVKTQHPINNLSVYYLFALANVVVSYLCVYKTSILSADQRGYLVSVISIVTNIVGTIFQIFSILLWSSYLVYLAIGTLRSILSNIIASHFASKAYPYINQREKLSSGERHSIFKNIGAAFIYKVSSVLLSATTNIVISVLINTAMVGVYSNYAMLQSKIMAFYSSIFLALTASIGNLIATESPLRRKQVFDSEQSLSFIFCVIVTPCYILLCNDFIHLWLGENYTLSFPLVIAVGLNLYLGCVFQPLWSYRDATGMYQHTKWVMAICAVLNLSLAAILGTRIGLLGIVLAAALSRLSTYAWFEPWVLFKLYFEDSPFKYYRDIVLNFIYIVVLTAILYIASSFFSVSTWPVLVVKALVIGTLCLSASIPLYIKTPGAKLLLQKIQVLAKKHE